MIFINEETLLTNTMDLNEFIDVLQGEIYNDDSEKAINCVIEFLLDVSERDQKLTEVVQKKISETLYPVVMIDISETGDMTKVDFQAISTDENFVAKKKDEVAFKEFCDKYFGSMRSLYDRLFYLDL